jgi:hypothetical protein
MKRFKNYKIYEVASVEAPRSFGSGNVLYYTHLSCNHTALPGFGKHTTKIFTYSEIHKLLGLLAKQGLDPVPEDPESKLGV